MCYFYRIILKSWKTNIGNVMKILFMISKYQQIFCLLLMMLRYFITFTMRIWHSKEIVFSTLQKHKSSHAIQNGRQWVSVEFWFCQNRTTEHKSVLAVGDIKCRHRWMMRNLQWNDTTYLTLIYYDHPPLTYLYHCLIRFISGFVPAPAQAVSV